MGEATILFQEKSIQAAPLGQALPALAIALQSLTQAEFMLS